MCTSDDLLDSLANHAAISKYNEEMDFSDCLPSLRGDTIISFKDAGFFSWLGKLASLTGINIENLETYKKAISARIDLFDAQGCLLSDHSFDSGFQYISTTASASADLFDNFLKGKYLSVADCMKLQSHLLQYLGVEYAKRKWKMQLHIGAHRFTSTKLRNKVGSAGGYACIGNTADVKSICLFLDELDIVDSLPKTILYTLNPSDNAVFASMTGSFSENNIRGKIQFGPAWWYNDNYQGIEQQLRDLSNYGLLSTTIGFTTDSRSILSFTRHDYYRRIVCNLIGLWIDEGKLPDDKPLLEELVKNITYQNIKNWIKK
jgi:glucuronate isomerase